MSEHLCAGSSSLKKAALPELVEALGLATRRSCWRRFGYKASTMRLVADAHSVYHHLYESGGVVEVGCWAH